MHTPFVFARSISLGARDLELRFANKRATSLPRDDETEYMFSFPFVLMGFSVTSKPNNFL